VAKSSSKSKFSPDITSKIAKAIAANSGNEVFFHAKTDDSGEITDVEAVAWGNETATPALLQFLEPGDIVIHNHPSGDLTPSQADIQIAAIIGNQGTGFYIVDNEAAKVKIIVDRYVSPRYNYLDLAKIAQELDDGSAVALKLPEYESRPGQKEMTMEAARCFNDGKIGLIEAGTGIGKTLAYLIPALYWALKNKERVLISTRTINLQEQLIFKDIPFLKTVFPRDFKAVLLKGRGNYVCLRRIDAEERDVNQFQQEILEDNLKTLQTLIAWSKKTKDGSLSDLNFVPKQDVWDRIKCENDTCIGIRCQFYEDCFLVNARREAARADILIVNHHLLFADLSLRGSFGSLADIAVLPPYTRIIIDEAHHTEEVSTEFFGTQVSQYGIKRLLNRILSYNRKGEPKGLLPLAAAKLRSDTRPGSREKITTATQLIEHELIDDKENLAQYAEDIFLDIAAFLQKKGLFSDENRQYRIDESFLEDREWTNLILVKYKGFIQGLRDFKKKLYTLVELLKKYAGSIKIDFENIIIELDAHVGRFGLTADTLYYLLFEPDKTVVKWIEITTKRKVVKICAAPIEVAESLKTTLFDPFKTVILTSATLTVGASFDFITSRLGIDRLDRTRINIVMVPSPFNFKEQVLIGIPLNNHPPDHPLFHTHAHNFIAKSLTISKGRAFVLFTSYKAMNEAFAHIPEMITQEQLTYLAQGADTRHNLLNRFRKEQPAVLFATDSFWEGVDVIGEALESIIIARLPFRVPTVPIEVARREAIDNAGGNSFMEYTVPKAVIKFKQGFGRLIRHKNDRGTILILDNRIVSKSYGRLFLESLPDCGLVSNRDDVVFRAFKDFYEYEM